MPSHGKFGDKLPENHMETFGLVRMVDFLGCDLFLVTVAEKLGTSVNRINNSNSIRDVRANIRNAYRWASSSSQIHRKLICSIRHQSLDCNLPKLHCLTVMECCGGKIQANCSANFPTCPICNQPYYLLPCCVCRSEIDVDMYKGR